MKNKQKFCMVAFGALIASAFGGVNTEFGNCETNGANFAYAPKWLNNRHMSLCTSNDYESANWWPVVDVAPTDVPTNMMAHAYGWAKHAYERPREVIDWHCITNAGGEAEWIPVTNTVYETKYWIERLYDQVMKPIAKPVPRKFSKLKIYVGLATLGRWEEVEAWLKEKTIGGVNGLTAFNLAQEVSEDNELFKPLLAEAKALLGWDDATVNEFLKQCLLVE